MRIGVVSKWIASGQAILARQMRSALEELGHTTFVLARPGSGPRAQQAATAAVDPVWDQEGVTEAGAHEIPAAEYREWVEANGIEVVLCDENYQFAELSELRGAGVRTIGRFVWEYFAPEHAAPAREAFETIYSLTRCEQERYAELGIESPYVPWGIHPELLRYMPGTSSASRPGVPGLEEGPGRQSARGLASEPAAPGGGPAVPGREAEETGGCIYFYFPGSFLGRRKPIRKVIRAFGRARGEHLRLLISAQVPRNDELLREAAAADPRIELALEDEPEEQHRARFAACDVCLAPSRWEGLGLPLFEATAFGLPIITNDKPPMSEMVLDGESGVLVASVRNGEARSGIPAWDPDVEELTAAIERLGERAELERMRAGVARLREQRAWRHTVAAIARLVEGSLR